ncbi:carbohydrate ABC transporter substrate-binding protein (CUT1 family) [Hypnocyclicus thermotrophus]|uniref:Carbohydrate ABC transporter substrate-binding protein (CUT1 family) n=1 Tax=Hypnocyclicus thermotrophus TaxID=1627895 RepID=A0AA46DYI1_9FUSO|nr:extracellular solute-binding protein [Hypnocyclicus thermotrophus]TDT70457.1 carbohydrate ABC transporter substrate-binding protein (CUT1 family) [Hypnocyclicus thermotrophus]
MKKRKLFLTLALMFSIMVVNVNAGLFFNKKKDVKEEKVKVNPNKPGWQQDDSKVTFDWYINYSWFGGKWGEDYVTKEITEKTGVSVNYIVPAGNGTEKLNTMIASGTLPDLITLDARDSIIDLMIKGGQVYSLDELAEKYDPYFFKIASKDKLNWFKQEDGHTYGYPNASYTLEDYKTATKISSNQTFLVRKDMYEAIGSPDMTTPEGFLKALRAVKEKFPTVNGQPIIPIGFQEGVENSLGDYLQNFLAVPLEKDGKVYDRYTDPDYIKWLKTFRQAYEEGLIATDVFVDKRSQIEEKMSQGRYFSMLYPHIDALRPLTVRYKEDPNSVYIAVDGPKNSKGDEHQLAGPGISGWTVTLISKNCKDPAKAIRFFTYMISEEGQRTVYLGKQGKTWDMIDGKPQLLPEVKKLREENRKAFDQIHGADDMHWMFMDVAMQQEKWGLPPAGPSKQPIEWTYGKVYPRFQMEMIEPKKNTPEGIIADKIALKRSTVIGKLITAESEKEFDDILQDFIDYRNKVGFEKLEAYRSKKMQENKAKLGLK